MVWHPEGLHAGNRDVGDGALKHSSWAAPQAGIAAPESRRGTAHRARTTAGPPRRNGLGNTARARSWSPPPAPLPGREGQAGPTGKGKVRTHPERWMDPQSEPGPCTAQAGLLGARPARPRAGGGGGLRGRESSAQPQSRGLKHTQPCPLLSLICSHGCTDGL